MGLFTKDTSKMEQMIERIVRSTVTAMISNSKTEAEQYFAKFRTVASLNEEIERLKLEKMRLNEEREKQNREIEHKIGLERKRQEFEVGAAKREAAL